MSGSLHPSQNVAPERVRNLAIVAHINAGKTTLCERILVATGRQRYFGEVDSGTAAMDWLREEQERGISIEAAVTHVAWREHRLQLVDTPGHVDFGSEVERSLRVVDGAIVVIDAVRGVESQTEAVWRRLDALAIPRLIFVNKLDRSTADLAKAMASIHERLTPSAVLLDIPIHDSTEVGFHCADLLESDLQPGERANAADPASLERTRLLERLGEVDDHVLAAYVEERTVSVEEVRDAISRATLARRFVPVLCGSALRDVGVRRMLDAVVDYLPGPTHHPLAKQSSLAAARAGACSDLGALVFAEGPEDDGGDGTVLVRVFAGAVAVGECVESQRGEAHRLAALYDVHADQLTPIDWSGVGGILALRAVPPVRLGDTLRAPGSDLVLESPVFAAPVLARSLEPDRSENRATVEQATRRLAAADPTLSVLVDEATGDLLIAGMGELHLDVFRDRLARHLGNTFAMGPLRVLRRLVPMHSAASRVRVERMLGPAADTDAATAGAADATAEVAIEPAPGRGLNLRWAVPPTETAAMESFAPDIRREILEEIESLVRRGVGGDSFADLVVEVRHVEVQPSLPAAVPLILEAVGQALREAMEESGARREAPSVVVTVDLPHDSVRPVLADLRSRSAEIVEIGGDSERARLLARVPLAQVLGWTTQLRSRTRGQGVHTMIPAGWVTDA
ncbi:MAG: GTP-binding protein [Planctomycetota bacterium]